MTVRFGNNRIGFYIAIFLLSGTVLGLAAHFASVFLPSLHRDFTIFALIVPSLTIFTFLLSLQWAQPQTEVITIFLLGVLWLTMGAWSGDIIGNVQCDTLGGQTVQIKNGLGSARSFCYEMKVIQAFSWAIFVLYAIAGYIIFVLVARAQAFGRVHIWSEPIRELPWFGEMPGYYNTISAGQPQAYPAGYGQGNPGYGYYPGPMTQPGSSIVIQPGMNGQPPTVTQIPHNA